MSYRPDIDGLRAIAILAVILFHNFPSLLPGGFVGVDIFFVISGFLISGILLREIASSTFSIRAFYARRIKRLFPALILVLITTLAVGWAILLEDEFQKLGWHTSAAASFISNIALWSESGYFDVEGNLKPLRHLWSLGIEEQFYFIWPLLIAIIFRLRIHFIAMAATLMVVSFFFNILFVATYPSGVFFLPGTRFWELIMGGILASVILSHTRMAADAAQQKPVRIPAKLGEIAAPLGLALIAIAILKTPEAGFPGWWALLPTLGATLLIGTGQKTWVARHILSNKAMVWIGLISYPLYLWHWPLNAFAHILYPEIPPVTVRIILTATATLLAWATYRWVETPLRLAAQKPQNSRRIITILSLIMLAFFGIGLTIHKGGVRERLHSLRAQLITARRDWKYPGDEKAFTPGSLPGTTLFFGDSYIQQLYPRIAYLDAQHIPHKTVIFHTSSGCAPIPGFSRKSNPQCGEHADQGFRLAAGPDIENIVIGGSWLGVITRGDYYELDDRDAKIINFADPAILDRTFMRLEKSLASLKSLGKNISIILHPPGGGRADPGTMDAAIRLRFSSKPEVKSVTMEEHLKRTAAINDQIRNIAKNLDISVIDPANWICSDDTCFFTEPDGTPLFKDATHFRASFIRDNATELDPLVVSSPPHMTGIK
ncbi:MAG: hypothetical protein A2018_08225 [Alphaproteobacteria bacterium GWF2_58_20]|nr:MAG: hypothetical protein A2018_08225 [Alphaproteobacteria bacterium GWF2_58_20]